MGGITYENVDERGRLHIIVLTKGREENGGGRERESRIIEVDNFVVCAGQDPKNDLEMIARGGRREREGGGVGSSRM